MEQSGAEILVRSLSDHGINTIFGYPGSCVMQILDNLYDNKEIKHILVRHEQGAVHAACGYSQISNKPGTVLVTSGPGATNTVTGIADAFSSGIPLLVITGQVSSFLLGTDAFQEADMISITAPVTKWNYQIRKADQIANAVTKALKIATHGRPGPVLLDITKDAQTGKAPYIPSNTFVNYSYSVAKNPETSGSFTGKTPYTKIIQTLNESGKNIILVIDIIPNTPYSRLYMDSGKILKSGIFGVAGFGLPAAIGAAFATSDKTICLITGTLEFQATIKELGVIKQQGLDIKIILFNDSHGNSGRIMNPDFIRLVSAYGITGKKIDANDDLRRNIHRMLNTTESYLLEICGSAI